jgi:hypothetical protein
MRRIIDSRYIIYITAALVSIFLSYWMNNQAILLNPDAICYLQSAQRAHLGLSAVMSLCDQSQWPFYSLLIAGVVNITTLSYEQAAFILNGLFSLLTVLLFIRIIAFFSDKRKILWLAALVILSAHEFNSLKQDVIRDHGFWSFYLLSILFLLHYFKQKKAVYVLGFSGSLLLAALFRIEGVIFLLLMPCLVWFEAKQSIISRFKSFLCSSSFMLLIAAVLLVTMLLHPAISLGRLYELRMHFQPSHFYSAVVQHYIALADTLGHTVLGRSEQDKYLIYFFTLVVWYLSIVISALSFIYAVLFVYALIKKLLPFDRNAAFVLFGYMAVNVLMTFIFLIENQFLSKRYVLALALICMLWVPFALDHLMTMTQRYQRKWPLVLAMSGLFIYGVSGVFHLGHSKQYIRDAGDWLHHYTPKTAVIYSNDFQVMYYSHHFGNDIFTKQREFSDLNKLQGGQWKEYDYLAIRLNKKMIAMQAALLNEIGEEPIIVFNGPHDEDQVRIYRMNKRFEDPIKVYRKGLRSEDPGKVYRMGLRSEDPGKVYRMSERSDDPDKVYQICQQSENQVREYHRSQ